jgi:hypothetical protein
VAVGSKTVTSRASGPIGNEIHALASLVAGPNLVLNEAEDRQA